jgi:hypothetical protein
MGPTNRTLENLVPGTTVSVDSLMPGSYTVVLEGFAGGEVDHFGRSQGVAVVAGQSTAAVVQFESFRPVLDDFVSPTTDLSFLVTWSPVPNADSYIVEIDETSGFTDPLTAPISGTAAVASMPEIGTFYARARAVNDLVSSGRAGEAKSIQLVTDIDPSGSTFNTSAFLGFGTVANTTLTQLNVFPLGDSDWFSVDACGGDVLVVETTAERLGPASELDTYLQIYESTGTNVVGENDDMSSNVLDSYVETELTDDGTYLIRVFAFQDATIGQYHLRVEVQPGPRNTGSSCQAP